MGGIIAGEAVIGELRPDRIAFIEAYGTVKPVDREEGERGDADIVAHLFQCVVGGEQRFGAERTIASTLRNPDFVAYARAFGALGLHADGPDQLRQRLDEAFAAGVPAIVHVSTGPMPDPWPWFLRGRAR